MEKVANEFAAIAARMKELESPERETISAADTVLHSRSILRRVLESRLRAILVKDFLAETVEIALPDWFNPEHHSVPEQIDMAGIVFKLNGRSAWIVYYNRATDLNTWASGRRMPNGSFAGIAGAPEIDRLTAPYSDEGRMVAEAVFVAYPKSMYEVKDECFSDERKAFMANLVSAFEDENFCKLVATKLFEHNRRMARRQP